MKTTIFFDLDGTLLPMNFDQFMHKYFNALARYFHDLIQPDKLQKAVMGGTEAMVKDQSNKTNETVFMNYFSQFVEGDLSNYQDRFNAFYTSDFQVVQTTTKPSLMMQEAVTLLKEKGYDLVIATNPLFPMAANLERLKWADLDSKDFKLITSLEANTKCKPSPLFYQELLDKLNLEPDNVLMVGNDYLEDLAASELGIETYIIKGNTLNDDIQKYKPDYATSETAFLSFVKALPNVKNQ
ncbi:MAG: HAD family hydrolase [Candidatus Izimaplasma sp.]|nr:HAD family hydrolase [Candidatus Izimaplasma bacterium]